MYGTASNQKVGNFRRSWKLVKLYLRKISKNGVFGTYDYVYILLFGLCLLWNPVQALCSIEEENYGNIKTTKIELISFVSYIKSKNYDALFSVEGLTWRNFVSTFVMQDVIFSHLLQRKFFTVYYSEQYIHSVMLFIILDEDNKLQYMNFP